MKINKLFPMEHVTSYKSPLADVLFYQLYKSIRRNVIKNSAFDCQATQIRDS